MPEIEEIPQSKDSNADSKAIPDPATTSDQGTTSGGTSAQKIDASEALKEASNYIKALYGDSADGAIKNATTTYENLSGENPDVAKQWAESFTTILRTQVELEKGLKNVYNNYQKFKTEHPAYQPRVNEGRYIRGDSQAIPADKSYIYSNDLIQRLQGEYNEELKDALSGIKNKDRDLLDRHVIGIATNLTTLISENQKVIDESLDPEKSSKKIKEYLNGKLPEARKQTEFQEDSKGAFQTFVDTTLPLISPYYRDVDDYAGIMSSQQKYTTESLSKQFNQKNISNPFYQKLHSKDNPPQSDYEKRLLQQYSDQCDEAEKERVRKLNEELKKANDASRSDVSDLQLKRQHQAAWQCLKLVAMANPFVGGALLSATFLGPLASIIGSGGFNSIVTLGIPGGAEGLSKVPILNLPGIMFDLAFETTAAPAADHAATFLTGEVVQVGLAAYGALSFANSELEHIGKKDDLKDKAKERFKAALKKSSKEQHDRKSNEYNLISDAEIIKIFEQGALNGSVKQGLDTISKKLQSGNDDAKILAQKIKNDLKKSMTSGDKAVLEPDQFELLALNDPIKLQDFLQKASANAEKLIPSFFKTISNDFIDKITEATRDVILENDGTNKDQVIRDAYNKRGLEQDPEHESAALTQLEKRRIVESYRDELSKFPYPSLKHDRQNPEQKQQQHKDILPPLTSASSGPGGPPKTPDVDKHRSITPRNPL